MTKTLLAGVALVAIFATSALAQQSDTRHARTRHAITRQPAAPQPGASCLGNEGRTGGSNPTCVNPVAAATARNLTVWGTQVMINQWMYPHPLSKDGTLPRGFDVNRIESSQAGSGSTNPFPPSP